GGLLRLRLVVVALVAVVLLVVLLALLVVCGVMSVMLVMGRRHHRLDQGGRQGKRGQGSEQVANPHDGISFLSWGDAPPGRKVKTGSPGVPRKPIGLPKPPNVRGDGRAGPRWW